MLEVSGITVYLYVTICLSHYLCSALAQKLSLSQNVNCGPLRMFINGFIECVLPLATFSPFSDNPHLLPSYLLCLLKCSSLVVLLTVQFPLLVYNQRDMIALNDNETKSLKTCKAVHQVPDICNLTVSSLENNPRTLLCNTVPAGNIRNHIARYYISILEGISGEFEMSKNQGNYVKM